MGDGKGLVGGPGGVGTGAEKRKTPSFLDGTLRRSFKTGSLKKQKVLAHLPQILDNWNYTLLRLQIYSSLTG